MRSRFLQSGEAVSKKNSTALRLQRVGLPRIGNGGHLPGDRFTLSVVVFVAVFWTKTGGFWKVNDLCNRIFVCS